MPRATPDPPAKPRPNAVVASAANITTRPKGVTTRTGGDGWQRIAWEFYDTVGELRFAVNWLGSAMSRVTLNVEMRTATGLEPVEVGPARDALEALFGGETARSQMLNTIGIHMSLPGETYLVGEPDENGGPDRWLVLSNEELTGTGTTWTVDRGDGTKHELPDDAMVIRIWRPHPRRWADADSSVRAVLPVLRELQQLTKHVAASVDSRLAGAGILMLPSEMTFDSPPTDALPTNPATDPFLAALTAAMLEPIADRSNAAAVVPIVVRAPAATLSDARLITFASPLDGQAQSLREEAIRRTALGMDLPPEIMLGQADSNHWSSWQIEESAIKVHIEPVLELVCDAITREYLAPVLVSQGVDAQPYVITADTSALRLRPDHSADATELYDRGELSSAALRREKGFDEADKPSSAELAAIITKHLALTTPTPSILKLVGIDAPDENPAPVLVEHDDNNAAPGVRHLPPAPVGTPEPQAATAVLAAAELLALRALERARNRLTKRSRGPMQAQRVEEVEEALIDAWVAVDDVAPLIGVDPDVLQECLHGYVRGRLLTAQPHDRQVLLRALTGQHAVA